MHSQNYTEARKQWRDAFFRLSVWVTQYGAAEASRVGDSVRIDWPGNWTQIYRAQIIVYNRYADRPVAFCVVLICLFKTIYAGKF